MKKLFLSVPLLALALSMPFNGLAANTGAQAQTLAVENTANAGVVVINGTGSSVQLPITAANLVEDVTLTATSGFEVFPTTLPAESANGTQVMVTLTSSLAKTNGQLILRSGDFRAYVNLVGYGTPLEVKDLSQNPVYKGTGDDETFTASDFTVGDNGYTVEFRVKTDNAAKAFNAYAVTEEGAGFKAFVSANDVSIYDGPDRKVSLTNPATTGEGGSGTFYNNDGKYHTYRIAVTPDKRMFVYRDGMPVDTLRTEDYGHQPDWAVENGNVEENLLKNPGFEGEFGGVVSGTIREVEGWQLNPFDQYNCTYFVVNQEINNELDKNNHIMQLNRYTWNDGWGAGTVSQIVDVAPNETYSLTFLARGGMKTEDDAIAELMASVKIQEVQNTDLGTSVDIENMGDFEEYSMSYTTTAECKQIKVTLYQERFLNGGGWGSSMEPFEVDEMQLTGTSRVLGQKAGFENEFGDVEYFTFDGTGAYAPPVTEIVPSSNNVVIDGTGNSATINIASSGLSEDTPITITTVGGFSVFPDEVTPNSSTDVIVTLESSMAESNGQLILRSGDTRSYITLKGYGSELEQKDLSQNPVYKGTGDDETFEHAVADGFTAGDNGYTVEFRVKTDNAAKAFNAYAVTEEGAGFKAFVSANDVSIYDGPDRKVSLTNPATTGEGGSGTFYNNDGKYHTYRIAVTPDKRMFVYRDGMPVDTLRTEDYGHQPDWAVENGNVEENLLKNPGFEGEFGGVVSGTIREVEGWQLNPFDQYNCTYFVVNQEINNELDKNNHIMQLNRYTWNDGWGAGTVSQIVDVAPNETYSLTFLARGGMKTEDDAIAELMASVKIQEVQNTDLGTSVDIENMGDFEEYSMSYTTTAECKQIKVTLYQERFLNGGGWGSSMEPFEVDEMQLTGTSRVLGQKAGFENEFGDVEYFTYDATGAYAPLLADLSDVEDAVVNNNLSWTVNNNQLVLSGVEDGTAIKVYDSMGLLLYATESYVSGDAIQLNGTSIIICEAVCNGQRQVFKAINK